MSKYIVVVSFEDYADNVSQVAFIAPSGESDPHYWENHENVANHIKEQWDHIDKIYWPKRIISVSVVPAQEYPYNV